LSLLAAALALAALVTWRRPVWRVAVLRRLARARAYARGRAAGVFEFSIPAVLAIMTVRGCYAQTGRAPALLVGSGLRARAMVAAGAARRSPRAFPTAACCTSRSSHKRHSCPSARSSRRPRRFHTCRVVTKSFCAPTRHHAQGAMVRVVHHRGVRR